MAGVWQTKDKSGTPHRRWRFWFVDWQGKRKWGTGTTNKAETLRVARRLEEEHREIRVGLRPHPKSGNRSRAFSKTVEEYLAWGKAQGGRGGRPWSKKHEASRERHLHWWKETMDLAMLSDLVGSLPRVEKALRDLQNKGRSPKTLANYAESLSAFCDWCVERDYLENDPLKRLKSFDTTPRTKRRALTPQEIRRLIEVAPLDRRLLYSLACVSGLRANELASLTVGHLDVVRGGLILDAEWTKNRKPGFQPLPEAVLVYLQKAFDGIPKSRRLLHVPSHPSRSLDMDLKAAGIRKWTDEGKVDFHSLRTTYTTLLIDSGANVKEAQNLLRHSTPELTMNVYARARSERLGEIADKVGECLGFEKKCEIYVKRETEGGGKTPVSPVVANSYGRARMVEAAGIESECGVVQPLEGRGVTPRLNSCCANLMFAKGRTILPTASATSTPRPSSTPKATRSDSTSARSRPRS